MLGADLIGFHINDYVEAFLESCRVAASGTISGNQIALADGHVARVSEFPMGIDYEKFAQAHKLKSCLLYTSRCV